MGTRIIIADDHAMFRQGLGFLLANQGFEVVAEADNGRDAVTAACRLAPEVAVLDLCMSDVNGLEAARQIGVHAPRTRVVLLTMLEEEACVREAFCAGVRGYVLKSQAATELGQALLDVALGRVYLSPGITGPLVRGCLRSVPPAADALTSKERQVLQLVAEGCSTKRIARLLNLAVKTVESCRNRIMQKLGDGNTAGLVRSAVRQGLIRP